MNMTLFLDPTLLQYPSNPALNSPHYVQFSHVRHTLPSPPHPNHNLQLLASQKEMEQTIPRRFRIISKQISGTQSPAMSRFIPPRMVDENAFDFDFVIRSSGTFDFRIIAGRWLDGDIQEQGVGK